MIGHQRSKSFVILINAMVVTGFLIQRNEVSQSIGKINVGFIYHYWV